MELPVLIEPLPDRDGVAAHLAAPFQLSVTAANAEEAIRQIGELLQQRLQKGMELGTLTIPVSKRGPAEGGWLPDDELTQDWLKHVQQFRMECDAADRARLENTSDQEGTSS